MTIENVIITINQVNPYNKLLFIKYVNALRGGGLFKSKELVESLPLTSASYENKAGSVIIKHLRTTTEWSMIKANIRKLKSL